MRLAAAAVAIAFAGAVAWSGQPVGIWEEAADETEPFLDMVAIAGGTFLMGSPEGEPGRDDDEKQHQVTVSAFRMGRTTVTRAQYREVMELDDAPGPGGDEHPVSKVSWRDAAVFCNRLSEREELTLCYRIEGEKVEWIEDAGGYRLPTEAEWEYAARAGKEGRWSFGDDEKKLEHHAWFRANSDGHAHPVAELEPNPWGLHDVHGNVWEWCWDVFAEYPEKTPPDPQRPESASGARRVVRGGSFFNEPRLLRSAVRGWDGPGDRYEFLGFRCVRRPRRQP